MSSPRTVSLAALVAAARGAARRRASIELISLEESVDGVADPAHGAGRQLREHRQREDGPGSLFRDGETAAVGQALIRRLLVHRDRVVDAGTDAALFQERGQRVAALGAQHVEMEHGPGAALAEGRQAQGKALELLVVERG